MGESGVQVLRVKLDTAVTPECLDQCSPKTGLRQIYGCSQYSLQPSGDQSLQGPRIVNSFLRRFLLLLTGFLAISWVIDSMLPSLLMYSFMYH